MCAKGGKLEANGGRFGGRADFDGQLLREDASFADTVFGAAAGHDLDAAAHVFALEFFVGQDASIVAELVGIIGWKVFGAKVVVGHGELGSIKLSDIAGASLVWYDVEIQ